MDIQQRISRQRIQHIVDSYSLAEDAAALAYLEALSRQYPHPLVELALTETLAQQWLSVPLARGVSFLQQAHSRLRQWQNQPIFSTITPRQFEQITGLDADPVFGTDDRPDNWPDDRLETPNRPAAATPGAGSE